MKSFPEIGKEIGELVEQKAEAYGHSFARCGDYLRLLYPDGISPAEYTDAMLLARDFDKSMRIANQPGAFGELPWDDKAGYAILGAHLHQRKKESSPCKSATSTSAGAADARTPLVPGHNDSAHRTVGAPSSPSVSAATEQLSTQRPSDIAERTTSAPALSATGAASPNEDDQLDPLSTLLERLVVLMRQCNHLQLCARCGHVVRSGTLQSSVWGEIFIVCRDCATVAPVWRKKLADARLILEGVR